METPSKNAKTDKVLRRSGTSEVNARPSPHSYPWFDYLRLIAALGVFASHSDRYQLLPDRLGNASVQIFFALSGFLIGEILLRTERDNLARFYFNRSARIWIPYVIAIGLVLAATVLKQSLNDSKLWEFFFYDLTFVYNWFGPPQLAEFIHRMPLDGTSNHFWSICVEEQFYLVAPFVVVFFRRALATVLIALVALNFFKPHDFAAISLGLLLALSHNNFGNWYVSSVSRAAIILVIAIDLFAIYSLPAWYYSLFPFTAVAIVALFASPGPRTAIGKIFGGMSYPFYLNAWVAGFAVNAAIKLFHLNEAFIPTAGLIVALALLGSFAHFKLIDEPISRLRPFYFTQKIGTICFTIGICLVSVGLTVGIFLRYFPIG